MSKLNIMWDARWPSLTVEERKFVETHRLIQEAAAVARQINRSEYVNQRMYVADLLLQRPNK